MSSETLTGLAHHLGEVIGADPETIKLILPKSRRGLPGKPAPSALQPLSAEWRGVTLAEAGITQVSNKGFFAGFVEVAHRMSSEVSS